MLNEVKITTPGITSTLNRLKFNENRFYKSIAQYIWNGFDAKATRVDLIYDFSSSGILKKLIIKDNGYGINHNELLSKFEPIFVSEKSGESTNSKHTSTFHGKNGVGRFTFFTFANNATWTTIYNDNGLNFKYNIEISANRLEFFSGLEATPDITNDLVGTTVKFTNFKRRKRKNKNSAKSVELEMVDYLKKEFCWYLELNSPGTKIFLNDIELDYSSLIKDKEEFKIVHAPSNTTFNVRYVQWLYFL
ncbi:MAG: ATP-binding protein, partial [Gammaproteobacteria bacterium]|nr:ATP-binding protein [Gammaproteobacteria bacterium]